MVYDFDISAFWRVNPKSLTKRVKLHDCVKKKTARMPVWQSDCCGGLVKCGGTIVFS